MRPTMVAGAISNERSLTARSPPKSLLSPVTASAGVASGGGGAAGLMRPDGASLLLPGVRGHRHVLAVRLGGDGGGIDRHLLAPLDLDHHRLDGHPVALGERRELPVPPPPGERVALDAQAPLAALATARFPHPPHPTPPPPRTRP